MNRITYCVEAGYDHTSFHDDFPQETEVTRHNLNNNFLFDNKSKSTIKIEKLQFYINIF